MSKMLSACGLDCASCESYLATQADDADKIAEIASQWSQQYGAEIKPEHVWCDGCVPGGERACAHVVECKIRACVIERGFENCAPCADYACDLLAGVFENAPEAKERLDALRAG
jgi:hypothetical protein